MLRTGRPQGQVPLLAADCVGVLIIREGDPISEPLVGRPMHGSGGHKQGKGDTESKV